MTSPSIDRRCLTLLTKGSQLAGLLVTLLGGSVLLGWLWDLQLLKSIQPDWSTMKPTTAVGFVLAGMALQVVQSSGVGQKWLGRGLSLALITLGLLTLTQYLLGSNLEIDPRMLREATGAIVTPSPGLMSPVTAFNFLFTGLAMLLLTAQRISYRLVQLLSLLTSLVSFQAVIGYFYGVNPPASLAPFTGVALHTALGFLLLSLGILFAAPTHGWMKLFVSNTTGGMTARILLPAAILVPAILGWLRLLGERAGWFDSVLGLSLHVLANVIVFMGLIWYSATLLYHLDLKRRQAEAALQASYDDLEAKVSQRTQELLQTNQALAAEIKERQRTEVALRESQGNIRALLNNTPAVIYLKDLQGRYLLVNQEFEALFGVAGVQVIGKTDQEVFPADLAAAFQTNDDQVLATGQAIEFEEAAPHADRLHTYISVKFPLYDDNQSLYAIGGISTDITARKQSEAALQKSLKDLADLKFAVDQSAIVAVTDTEGTITYVNDRFCELSQYTRAELVGQNHRLIKSDYHPPAFFQRMWDTITQGQVWEGEIQNRAKDGSPYWEATTIVPLLNSEGQPYQYISIRHDITSRKQAEAALSQSEERFRRAILDAPLPIMLHLENGEILQVNQAWRDLTGYRFEEVSSLDLWLERAYGHLSEQVRTEITRVFSLESQTAMGEYPITTSTGDTRFWNIHVSPLGAMSDGRRVVVVMGLDVTERRRIELEQQRLALELQQQLTQSQTLLEVIPIGIGIAEDPNCQKIRVNPAFAEVLNIPPDTNASLTAPVGERPGFKVYQNGQEISPEELPLQYAAKHGVEVRDLELEVVWDDGTVVTLLEYAAPLLDEQGQPRGSIGAFLNITDRKRAEAEVHRLNATLEQRVEERTAQLEEVNQELKQFTYTVSHDLRAPLRAIHGLIEALVEDYGDHLDETAQQYTQQIAAAAQRMDLLIQDLLTYSRLTQTEIQLQPVDLTAVMQELLIQLKAERQTKQATITVDLPLPRVMGQRTIVTQILMNLLTNGLKYVAPGVAPHLQVWAESHPERVRVWVADNGIGIAPEYQERIFRVFERLHAIGSYSGTGVGLAIVQRGIERLGGRVGVESQVGQGCRFWIELPPA